MCFASFSATETQGTVRVHIFVHFLLNRDFSYMCFSNQKTQIEVNEFMAVLDILDWSQVDSSQCTWCFALGVCWLSVCLNIAPNEP